MAAKKNEGSASSSATPATASAPSSEVEIEDMLPELDIDLQVAEQEAAEEKAAKDSVGTLEAGKAKVGTPTDAPTERLVKIKSRSNYPGLRMGPNEYSFIKGQVYEVPFSVADHLRQLGII